MSAALLWLLIGLCMAGWGVLVTLADGMSDNPNDRMPFGVPLACIGALVAVVAGIALVSGVLRRSPMSEADQQKAMAQCRAEGREPYALHQHADSGYVTGIECGEGGRVIR